MVALAKEEAKGENQGAEKEESLREEQKHVE